MSQKGIVLFVVMHVNRPYTALKRHTNRQNRQNWRKLWRYQGKIVTLSVNLFSTSSNESQFNKNRTFSASKKVRFWPFAPCKTSYRTFSHPKKVRFYPWLRARPHIVLFHTRKKYDFARRSVRDLISYFFTPEKSTILPVAPCVQHDLQFCCSSCPNMNKSCLILRQLLELLVKTTD